MGDDDDFLEEFGMVDDSGENAVDEMLVDDILGAPSSISSSISWLVDNHFRETPIGQYKRTFAYRGIGFEATVGINSMNGECTAYCTNLEESIFLTFHNISRHEATALARKYGNSVKRDCAERAVRDFISLVTRLVDEASQMESSTMDEIDPGIWTFPDDGGKNV